MHLNKLENLPRKLIQVEIPNPSFDLLLGAMSMRGYFPYVTSDYMKEIVRAAQLVDSLGIHPRDISMLEFGAHQFKTFLDADDPHCGAIAFYFAVHPDALWEYHAFDPEFSKRELNKYLSKERIRIEDFKKSGRKSIRGDPGLFIETFEKRGLSEIITNFSFDSYSDAELFVERVLSQDRIPLITSHAVLTPEADYKKEFPFWKLKGLHLHTFAGEEWGLNRVYDLAVLRDFVRTKFCVSTEPIKILDGDTFVCSWVIS